MRTDWMLSVAIAWIVALLLVSLIELTARMVPTGDGAPGIVDPSQPRLIVAPPAGASRLADCDFEEVEPMRDRTRLTEGRSLDAQTQDVSPDPRFAAAC